MTITGTRPGGSKRRPGVGFYYRNVTETDISNRRGRPSAGLAGALLLGPLENSHTLWYS